ncbi:MAG: diguanylate cyclase [Smithellaceae bacterium]
MAKHILIILSFLFLVACGADPIDKANSIFLGQLQALEDPQGHLIINDILNNQDAFHDVLEKAPGHYFTSSAWWFRLPVQNKSFEDANLFLDVLYPTLDDVRLFVVDKNGVRGFQRTGDRIPADRRPFTDAMTLIMPFDLAAGASADLYIRVQGEAQALVFPFEIRDEKSLRKSLLKDWFIHGIMVGIFIALWFYNLLLYIMLREPSRLYFMAYLPFAFLGFTALDGFGSAVLYPDNNWFGNEGAVFFHGLSSLFILLFTRVFLQTDKGVTFDRWVTALAGVSTLMMLSVFVMPVRLTYYLSATMLPLIPLTLLLFSFVVWRRGKTEIRFYVLAQMFSFMGALFFSLMIAGLLPFSKLLLEAIAIGVCSGAMMHSLAIADRIRILQRQNIEAEDAALRNLEIRKEELERLVNERTAQLDKARREAELQATTDLLTGVYNRRGLLVAAERELRLTLRHGRPLAIAMLDIDFFKKINDSYGHLEGDRILRDLAQLISREIRSTDLFGRVGGEEFLLIMPDTPAQAAIELAERLRGLIAEKITVGSPAQSVTASFGVAWLTEKRTTPASLILNADKALYLAKQNGRNRVETSDTMT